MKTFFKYFGILMALVVGIFLFGPRPQFEQVNNTPLETRFQLKELDEIISKRESVVPNLKEDNEARIIWRDSIPSKTEYSIVYLHGFTASQGEGYPMHLNLQERLGANMYLPRLPEHGINHKDVMKELSPKMLVEAAKEAIAIGKSIGDKVLLMGCSTGGTLGIYLAAGDPDLAALILLSPNIALKSGAASLMTGPWGRQLAYQMIGENRDMTNFQNSKEYWTYQHHTNGLIALQALMDQTMKEDYFVQIDMPVYCGYFYKNEELQDPVVSVQAMLSFKDQLKTPSEKLEFEAFEEGNHVLGSIYKNENWEEVQEEVWDFISEKILKK